MRCHEPGRPQKVSEVQMLQLAEPSFPKTCPTHVQNLVSVLCFKLCAEL